MSKMLLLLVAALAASLFVTSKPNGGQEKPKESEPAASGEKIPQEDIDRKNPVKPTPEGITAARRMYTYDCSMCHGANGDGKGDLVESMKLTLHDWRDPASLADKTDGELFYIITHGKGKMPAEKGRASDTTCWDFVNLIRSFARKDAAEKPKS